MRKELHSLIIVIYLLGIGLLFAGNTGKISGKIIDAASGAPLPGANVIITHRWMGDDEALINSPQGAATDADGIYYILNIEPGEYSVTVSYIGYSSSRLTNIYVYVDKTVYLDVPLDAQALQGKNVTVVAYKENSVEVDLTATKQVYNMSEITDMAGVSDISDILNMQADVVDDHFRGGRLGESQYILGGGAIVNPLNNSRAASEDLMQDCFSQCKVSNVTFGFKDFSEAYRAAERKAKEGDLILVFGSFFLVSEFLANAENT